MAETALLNYTTQGEGAPVILVHGVAASNQHWHPLLLALEQAGFQGFAPDLLGHGESAKPLEPAHYAAQAVYDVFERWLENLAVQRSIRLVGHSLGGFMSLLYTYHHPQNVAGLVLIDPYLNPNQLPLHLRLINRRPALASRVFKHTPAWLLNLIFDMDLSETHHFPQQVRDEIAGDYLRASPNIIYLGCSIWDLTPVLSEIRTPTLVIWGDRDRTLKPGSFARIAQQIPQVEVYPIAGSGHQPHIGRSDEINRRVVEFFRRL